MGLAGQLARVWCTRAFHFCSLTAQLTPTSHHPYAHTPTHPCAHSHPGQHLRPPVLLLWADSDPALGVELIQGLGDLIDDYECHVIPDCSHWAPWDRPDEVNRLMSDWLQRHPLAPEEGKCGGGGEEVQRW